MSTKENDIWLEGIKEDFEGAISDGLWDRAWDILKEVSVAGFMTEYYQLLSTYNFERFENR